MIMPMKYISSEERLLLDLKYVKSRITDIKHVTTKTGGILITYKFLDKEYCTRIEGGRMTREYLEHVVSLNYVAYNHIVTGQNA